MWTKLGLLIFKNSSYGQADKVIYWNDGYMIWYNKKKCWECESTKKKCVNNNWWCSSGLTIVLVLQSILFSSEWSSCTQNYFMRHIRTLHNSTYLSYSHTNEEENKTMRMLLYPIKPRKRVLFHMIEQRNSYNHHRIWLLNIPISQVGFKRKRLFHFLFKLDKYQVPSSLQIPPPPPTIVW